MNNKLWICGLSALWLAACASTDSNSGREAQDAANETPDMDIPENMSDWPAITEEGLHRVPDSRVAVVYADPEADLGLYDEVMILDVFISFRKNWQRDQNRTSASNMRVTQGDIDRIKDRLATEFNEVFHEVLEADGGFPIVDEAGESVLLLRPAIINLDVNAPDTMSAGRSRTFAEQAGSMTLYLEVYDSVTGALIAKAIDAQADRRQGFATWQTSVSNRQAARRILTDWAQALRDALDEAHPNR